MSLFGAYTTSTLGMMAQAHALSVIGSNVANVNTGGFKKTDATFSSLLGNAVANEPALGGVSTRDFQRIDVQGTIVSSPSDYDLSINGQGFFVLNTKVDGTGQQLYTRDGAFHVASGGDTTATADDGNTITVQTGYLVDKNGYYVQGWQPSSDGSFSTTGSLSSMRIDQYAFADTGTPTTTGELAANLPANAAEGDNYVYNINLIDSNGAPKSATMNFTKNAAAGEWTMSVTAGAGDTVNSASTTMTFDSNAQLVSPTSYNVNIAWSDGATSNVALDLSNFTQFAGDFLPQNYQQNGVRAASLSGISFDQLGHLIGNFEDTTSRNLYKVALATFPNENSLKMLNGNVFEQSTLSGSANLVEASTNGYALFNPNSHEMSNVDIADEFSRMIMTQQAYNSSATVFKTVDQMTETARDLKR